MQLGTWETWILNRLLGHYHVTGHHEAIASPHSLERILEEIARCRCAEMLQAAITTEGEEVEIPRVFVAYEPSWHRRLA